MATTVTVERSEKKPMHPALTALIGFLLGAGVGYVATASSKWGKKTTPSGKLAESGSGR